MVRTGIDWFKKYNKKAQSIKNWALKWLTQLDS